LSSWFQVRRIVAVSWLDSGFGSYRGKVVIASTAPVFGSSATTAPLRPRSCRSAVSWAIGFRVSTSVPPGLDRAVNRSTRF
jgi:hypothetical protein